MAWSTRQVAELAGTTLKAVRHYHEIGLLDVPERTANGYKQYGVSHLIRLVQIRRLSELGVPLSEIAAMEHGDREPDEAIRVLDAELEAKIDRLTRVREELADILRHRAPAHAPPGFASVYGDLSERQRSLLAVYSTVLSEKSTEELRALISEPDATEQEFEALPPDADDASIADLAERLVPGTLRARERSPWSRDPTSDSPQGSRQAARAMADAAAELYNPAQLRVLKRLIELMAETAGGTGDEAR
ncbi:MerR family transcriptional regulator [Nocardiopsis sp. N85]|uniref:MerR family transcriptional regulator n=1 Tax=Nocardiopsis sp. N85 TaxID=3029400 RepID=UPI00237FAE8C|nr:MerR family transcriptional regulator [Nocardiopsis sp. N85]MDE3723807.1 MerR family transcriptional regulator [Nocardiopsis sp. N85]